MSTEEEKTPNPPLRGYGTPDPQPRAERIRRFFHWALGVRRFVSTVEKEHPRIPIGMHRLQFNRPALLPFSTVSRAQFVAIVSAIGRNFGSRPAE
jgi:hypothetical protein